MVMSERLFSNYQNESVITFKMKVFSDQFRKNTIKLEALNAFFLHFVTFILKDYLYIYQSDPAVLYFSNSFLRTLSHKREEKEKGIG